MTYDKNNKREHEMPAQNEAELVDKLVQGLLDKTIPDDLHVRLADWFGSAAREDEKLGALEKYMYENLKPNEDLTKASTMKRFEELAARLGIEIPATTKTQQAASRRKPLRRNIVWRVAAVLLPVIMIVGGYLWYDTTRTPAGDGFAATYSISAPADGHRHIVLADGTEVTLNSGSELAYDENRKCSLVGEAYFKVTKSDIPFVVHTDKVDVTVLGTEFNLSAYPGGGFSTVTLYSGSVHLDYDEGSYRLAPATEFSYNNLTHEITTRPVTTPGNKPGWIGEQPVSQLYSLGEIFRMVESRYAVTIENKDIADTTLHYAFRFADDSIDTVMRSLKIASGDFDYRIEGNTVRLEPIKK